MRSSRLARASYRASPAIASRPGVEETTEIVDPDASRVDLLKGIPLFATLSPDELEVVASAAHELRVPAGETLVSQATAGRGGGGVVGGSAHGGEDGGGV